MQPRVIDLMSLNRRRELREKLPSFSSVLLVKLKQIMVIRTESFSRFLRIIIEYRSSECEIHLVWQHLSSSAFPSCRQKRTMWKGAAEPIIRYHKFPEDETSCKLFSCRYDAPVILIVLERCGSWVTSFRSWQPIVAEEKYFGEKLWEIRNEERFRRRIKQI